MILGRTPSDPAEMRSAMKAASPVSSGLQTSAVLVGAEPHVLQWISQVTIVCNTTWTKLQRSRQS